MEKYIIHTDASSDSILSWINSILISGRSDIFEYDDSDFIHQTPPWADPSPVRNSRFDQTLKSQWDASMKKGYFRYNIDHIITRILPGSKQYVGQDVENHSECHSTEHEEDDTASLVINVSPMEYGHCLLVPQRLSCLPQILTKKALTIGIEAMLLSNQRSLIMGFNSLCAFASLNHLHFHFFYLEYELIADHCPMQHLAGQVYEFNAVPCPGFGLQLHGSSVEEMVRLAYGMSSYLHENDVAHNIFFCRGVVFNEPRDSHLTTLRLFIWPRKKFIGNKSSEEFNVACLELGGYLPIRVEAGYHSLTEAEVDAIIADASLPQSEYETIKKYFIQMGLKNEAQSHMS